MLPPTPVVLLPPAVAATVGRSGRDVHAAGTVAMIKAARAPAQTPELDDVICMKWDLSAEYFAAAVSRRSAQRANLFRMKKARSPSTIANTAAYGNGTGKPATDSSQLRLAIALPRQLPLG
jgi:hypothetical protein